MEAQDSMLLCAADALIWPPILIQPNCASAGAGSDSDSDYDPEAGHPGRIMLCVLGLIMILILSPSLIPHRLHRRRTSSWAQAPVARTLEQCRDMLYQHAGSGLRPLSWGSLQLGPGNGAALSARPIEMLARMEFKAEQEHAEAMDHFLVIRMSSTAEQMIWLRQAEDTQLAHESAAWRRREQAWHYGMLVCRALFWIIPASPHMPEKVARFLDVVELVELFLNG